MTERISPQPDIERIYKEFKEVNGIGFVIGVIGGSKALELSYYESFLKDGISRLGEAGLKETAMLSGGTEGGVPEMAINVGRQLNLKTIGVFPEKGAKYALKDKLDLGIAVPGLPLSEVTWGSETPVMISLPDVFVLIGGEWGTLAEVSMIMKDNVSRDLKNAKLRPVIALRGTRGVSDKFDELCRALDTPSGSYFGVHNTRMLGELLKKIHAAK